ncbi:MAG: putative DNA-binding domain-containing protein [Bradymonadia bacterium]
MLKDVIERFSDTILRHNSLISEELFTEETRGNLKIYMLHYIVTTRQVLEDFYPVTRTLLGERNFNLFAWRYAQTDPPTGVSLDHYGVRFPQFLAQQPEIQRNQPVLSLFAVFDFMSNHLEAPPRAEIECPEHLPRHYASVRDYGELLDEPLGEPTRMVLESGRGAGRRAR